MDTLTCSTCATVYPIRELDHGTTLRCIRCGGILAAHGARPAPVELPAAAPASGLPDKERFLGPYRLIRRLGKGGMGVVFEAADTRAGGRRVALKTFELKHADAPDVAGEVEALLREARACAAIPSHPNVVPLLDALRVGSSICLVMELIDGCPLQEWRRDGNPPIPRQVALLRDCALALDHIHRHGIVHRDLKPENVLVDREGRPHLTDLGLARIRDGEDSTTTVTGSVVGTPAYMAPEQALKPRNADERSDVFSLGVMLYETLTGLLPFTGRSTVGLLMSIMNDTPPPPSRSLGGRPPGEIDAAMDAICMKALAKKPGERYPTARAFAEALGVWLSKAT